MNTINSDWQWQHWQGLPYLTCKLLASWQHGFFTQQCYPHTPEKLVTALDTEATPYRLKQVHGNVVLTPSEMSQILEPGQKLVDGDGIFGNDNKQAVWVASADCNPILIADSKTGKYAVLSDILGNHQFSLYTDLFYNIKNSNFQFGYY